MRRLALVIFALTLLFTRFYNLPFTTRYTRDESSNLMDMHRIAVERKVTLIGPIDVNNIIIYPSLTFYMLLPFSLVDDFTTWSPAVGTAVYGIITIVLLLHLTNKVNRKIIIPISFLFIVMHPLVETQRWAWNPHIVPFMQSLAFIFWFRKSNWSALIAGVFFGLAFHLHYFSIVSFVVFGLISLVLSFKQKNIKRVILMGIGACITLIPFVIFDLRNPPGLFFGKFLSDNLVSQGIGTEAINLPRSILENISNSLLYLTQSSFLAILLGLSIFGLLVYDFIHSRQAYIYLLPVIAQVIAISFLPGYAGRYFLLAIVFFIIWLIIPRRNWGNRLVIISIGMIIVGGIKVLPRTITYPSHEPGAYIVEKASTVIANSIKTNDLKNVNLATVASPDPDPLGAIYRHTLLVKEVRILSAGEYSITDNLFVISTADENSIRSDPTILMNSFRDGKIRELSTIEDTMWKIYLVNRF